MLVAVKGSSSNDLLHMLGMDWRAPPAALAVAAVLSAAAAAAQQCCGSRCAAGTVQYCLRDDHSKSLARLAGHNGLQFCSGAAAPGHVY